MIDVSQFQQVFLDEAAEHLASFEGLLLGLDLAAPELEQLNAIFRAAHSIKGGAATFGLTDVAEFTHVLEALLDRVRKGELRPTRSMVDALLAGADLLRALLATRRDGPAVERAELHAVQARIQAQGEGGGGPAVQAKPSPAAVPVRRVIALRAALQREHADNLLAALRALGQVEVLEQPRRRAARPLWRIAHTSATSMQDLQELLQFVVEPDAVDIREEPAAADLPAAAGDSGFGFFDDAPGAPPAAPSQEDLGYGFFEPAVTVEAAAAPLESAVQHSSGATSAVHEQASVQRREAANSESSSIRVSVEKVDQLINLVGELVITQSMLAQTALGNDAVLSSEMAEGLSQLERNTRDLQEAVMSIRMLPIAFVFSRFPRMVHDLASRLGKRVQLRTLGEGTELDRGVIEKIADPLTHLVRNSLDHGIEAPDVRVARGKPAQGTLTLRAFHQGGSIVVEVSDDGGGLDRARILAKARERGMPVGDALSDQEVWQLVFEPGFSTAQNVTDVSGRGVGMDVVRRNVQAAGGRVELHSDPGAGTTVTIRLPLTLAILDGMSVRVGDERYILPLGAVMESLQPAPQDVRTVTGTGRVLPVRGRHLPVLALADVFGVPGPRRPPHETVVVIVEAGAGQIALQVDELLGQHQVVIKSLESNYRRVPHVSGATIMGDGRVALILDVAALVRSAATAIPEAA
jgi:two-component system chemotaxis sensor kinase CheA